MGHDDRGIDQLLRRAAWSIRHTIRALRVLTAARPGDPADGCAVYQAYRFALDPTPTQRRALASAVGGARFAYNWGLELVKRRLDERAAGHDVQIPWTLPALRREWNRAKHQAAPWWADNSKEAYSSGLDGLARALKNFIASRQGRRKGRPVGFPCFKRRGRRDACRFTTGAIRVLPDRNHVQLPRIGIIKTHESTRKLARHLERGTGRILAATITRVAGRWYVAFTCEITRQLPMSNGRTSTVGVDLGVRHLAILSTGEKVPNPRPLQRVQHKRRRLQRRWNRQERERIGSLRPHPSRRQQQTRQRLAVVEARAASIRRDGLHKLTTRLVNDHGTVVVEHLNVAGMLRNHHLARALSEAGFAQLRRLLGYKAIWYGARLVEADPFFPSSKTCSACGTARATLRLDERTFRCENRTCGLVLDRDLNASRNLAKLADHVAQSGWETTNARGVDVRPGLAGRTAMNREAGAGGSPGQTGTVDAQAPTARPAAT
jgi:putative transposase